MSVLSTVHTTDGRPARVSPGPATCEETSGGNSSSSGRSASPTPGPSSSPKTPLTLSRKRREDQREPPAWFKEFSKKSLQLQETLVEESKRKNDLLEKLLEKL
ncbi:hypothetical protein BaRGS_00036730 [Batillaria attramentaria]|uniref:Uncharacterized protein n=1 Tax=Batillaria attramentaria TaxID=370345 RepID=A0ABD0JBC4_9CAEN